MRLDWGDTPTFEWLLEEGYFEELYQGYKQALLDERGNGIVTVAKQLVDLTKAIRWAGCQLWETQQGGWQWRPKYWWSDHPSDMHWEWLDADASKMPEADLESLIDKVTNLASGGGVSLKWHLFNTSLHLQYLSNMTSAPNILPTNLFSKNPPKINSSILLPLLELRQSKHSTSLTYPNPQRFCFTGIVTTPSIFVRLTSFENMLRIFMCVKGPAKKNPGVNQSNFDSVQLQHSTLFTEPAESVIG